MTPTNISRTTLGKGKFLGLDEITWVDQNGVRRKWESAERASQTHAVGIIAWLKPSDRLLLIQQYRPPVGKEVIEFPAGLIDHGESPEIAAARELREETGYMAEQLKPWPFGCSSAGLTSECLSLVTAVIDESNPQNHHPKVDFQDGESIRTHLVPRNQLFSFMQEHINKGLMFDAKLLAYLAAFYQT